MTRESKPRPSKGRARFFADLDHLYPAPGHALYLDPSIGLENPRAAKLIIGHRNCGAEPPLTKNGKDLQGGSEQFHALGEREEKYYPPKTDRIIIAHYIAQFIKQMRQDVLVDMCSGEAVKVAFMLKKSIDHYIESKYPGVERTLQMVEEAKKEVWPRHIILNDKDPKALRRAGDILIKAGFPKNHIHTLPGDIRDPALWASLRTLLHQYDSSHPLVTMMCATINDFNRDQRKAIVRNFCSLSGVSADDHHADRPHFFLAVDLTDNRKVLKDAYANSAMMQFFLTGTEAYLKLRASMNQAFDPALAVVDVNFRTHKGGTHIQTTVKDPHNECVWGTIEKISNREAFSSFQKAGAAIAGVMAREDRAYDGIEYVYYDLYKEPSSRSRRSTGDLAL